MAIGTAYSITFTVLIYLFYLENVVSNIDLPFLYNISLARIPCSE